MWGLAGYQPAAMTSVAEVIERHADRLNQLTGRELSGAYGLYFHTEPDWCTTLPIVLDFEGSRVDLAADGWDRFYLSWGELDLTRPPDADDQDDPDLAVGWAPLALPEIKSVMGQPVWEIRVLETLSSVPDGTHGDAAGQVEAWLLGGLEFVFGDGRALQVYNGLNAIDVAADDPGSPGRRRTDITG